MFDITFNRDRAGWFFKAHSQRAADFLASEFIGVAGDLSLSNCFAIIARACERGLRVNDRTI